ncbi:hypothetical protein N780_06980 [Pontibacillus chungwhensis BH030062]|uniref:Uncharacterized protein n=2 Tax=Pontibacillus TaxID=289201 RepID=A0A0A2UPC1_9BACI|nr:hypothetical protein [Pontibacillus chungwhensis]KGP90147.1 hypothetical protein N780_06980 [Pontibacillus chungwhensis BH030062]GGD29183.1 hypothetical protein GCM10011389_40890 [Pontibacillus salipaludis]
MAVKKSNEKSISLLWKVIFLIMALIILTAIFIFIAYANFNDEETSYNVISSSTLYANRLFSNAC